MKQQLINMNGKRFGRLTVVSRAMNRGTRNGLAYWNCVCDCGKKITVCGALLRNGRTRSCGCERGKYIGRANAARVFKKSTIEKHRINGLKRKHSIETKRKLSIIRQGEKNPAWSGGLTPLVRRIRHLYQYRQWRSDVFTRDDFTCQDCGKRGGHLHAHHSSKTFWQIINEYKITTIEQAIACDELWNINNGVTLCKDCHGKYPRK